LNVKHPKIPGVRSFSAFVHSLTPVEAFAIQRDIQSTKPSSAIRVWDFLFKRIGKQIPNPQTRLPTKTAADTNPGVSKFMQPRRKVGELTV